MTKLIEANTTIPTSKKEIFSTAVDNQSAVTIVVLQGERPMAKDNKEIARFNLDGIAPAPRGIPQIEVSFDIDANGILSVKAEDKGTGKEQHITIQNPNALSQEEIDRIKADAEKYKEEDARKEEENKKLNEAEGYAYSVEKSLKEENISKLFNDEQKKQMSDYVNEIHEAAQKRDIEKAEENKKNIENIFNPEIEKMYKNMSGQQSTNSGSNPFSAFGGTDNPFNGFDFSKSNYGSQNQKPDSDGTENVPYEEVK